MKKKRFCSRSNSISDKQAQKYGEELERIKAREGKLNPALIVQYAGSSRSPLHEYFDWDNTEAASKWRHQQAINLVGLVSEVVVIEGKRTKQRSFFGIKTGRTGVSYVTINEVRTNKDYREKLIDDISQHLKNTQELLLMLKRY